MKYLGVSLKKFLSFLWVSLSASAFNAIIAEKKIMRQISHQKESDSTELSDLAPIEVLDRYMLKVKEDKATVETKARTSLFGITLAVSIIFASIGIYADESSSIPIKGNLGVILIGVGVLYFLLSGLTAFKAIDIGKWYDASLEDHLDSKQARSIMQRSIKLNNLTTLIRSNYTAVSLKAMRNGVVAIALYFLLVVGKLLLSSN